MATLGSQLRAMARRASALLNDAKGREVVVNNLLKEFSDTHGLVKSLGHPRIFQLETTNYCPYTCNMCPRTHSMTRELGHMDIGLFRAILDQIEPAWQVDDVGEEPYIALWHFGEPMVYKHLSEAIEYAHSRGLPRHHIHQSLHLDRQSHRRNSRPWCRRNVRHDGRNGRRYIHGHPAVARRASFAARPTFATCSRRKPH